MSAQRSAQPEVRNPVLALEATQQLLALPPESRAALAAVLEELATDAHQRAEKAWRQRKGPMAAYWRAVGVYARHTARATRRGTSAGLPAEGRVLADVEADGVHLQLREVPPAEPWWVGRRDRDQLTGAYIPGTERQDPLTGEWH